MHIAHSRTWVGLLAWVSAVSAAFSADSRPEPPGLGDPGTLLSISLETGRSQNGRFLLAGRDSGQQLLVVGHYDSGQLRDLTRSVTYKLSPEGVVSIDETGCVSAVKDGEATIHVTAAPGIDVAICAEVTNIAQDLPIGFSNQVVPIFTKHGCNSGGCHGKSGGQNGFGLSLLGFEPAEDYEHLLKEARGRRLFPAAPDRSLLLLKGTGQLPHGGGQRIDADSPAYRTLRRWIEQGMPYGKPDDPTLARIEVLPQERMLGRDYQQQLIVVAHYTDGSTADVTRCTTFDSNDAELATVDVRGLVTTKKLTGSVAIMARHQGQVGVFRGTIPLGVPVDDLPPPKNLIDELVFAKLKALGLPPSPLATDTTFLRRATIDIAGRLPTLAETEQFLADRDPNKRAQWIDRLLASSDYAEYFANKWNAVLRNKRRAESDKAATFAFHDWLRRNLYENTPYDQLVRELLAATGEPGRHPPAAWYREVPDPTSQVEDTAQLFLGLRIQCARCHHHPFEKWSQQDYFGFQAFFTQVGRKKGEVASLDRIYHRRGVAQARHPKTGAILKPTGLGGAPLDIGPDEDPRLRLVDWLAASDNPFFARALVNRYWKHFFGRGLVDPDDDMRATNPAVNPALLDALAKDFVEHRYDLKQLIRTIGNSQVYQLSAEPNPWNADDKQNFSRYYPKRLNAEVLLDAIDQLTAAPSNFGGLPAGTRAVELPDNGFDSYFLTVFGRPEATSACECERSGEANLAQCLHLLNSRAIQGKLTLGSGRAAQWAAAATRPTAAKIRELYLLAVSREPTAEETAAAVTHVERHAANPRWAYEDIVWSMLNTKEFLFNH
jgi:hypothetical protein